MRNLLFFLLLGMSAFASVQEERSKSNHQFHQKLYDYYNVQPGLKPPTLQTMTGDWNGARTYLENHGVEINSSFVSDNVGNPVGGEARGFTYTGSFGVGLGIDFGKAAGWTGTKFYGSVVWRTGTNLSRTKIHNQFTVQQVYGSQTVKLNELYLQQALWSGTMIAKAGRLDAGNDFLASPLYGQFVNNAFDGNPVAVFNNFASFTAYPNASWGAYLAIYPISQLIFKFAVYNANSHIFLNKYHGINFTLESTNGVIWITEWAWVPNQNRGDTGLPGNYKVGFFYQTGAATVFSTNTPTNGDYCGYILFDQMIYRPNGPGTEEGLTPFIALLFAPENRNLFPFFCTAGLVYRGLIQGRPRDTTNFGVAYGHYSSEREAVQRSARKSGLIGPFGNRPQSAETVLEFNHWFQINDWFTFTPDVQYVINPKGYGTIPNALVVGAQIGMTL